MEGLGGSHGVWDVSGGEDLGRARGGWAVALYMRLLSSQHPHPQVRTGQPGTRLVGGKDGVEVSGGAW